MDKKVVKVRDLVIGEGRPKICVPLTSGDLMELCHDAKQLRGKKFDLVEWRADYYLPILRPGEIQRAITELRDILGNTPILFTLRRKEEGGEIELALVEYISLCKWAGSSGKIDLIDVELSLDPELAESLIEILHGWEVKTICSCHDFEKTPPKEEMIKILRKMQEVGADITKLAVMPKTRRDVLELLEASVEMEEQYADRPFITMSMGTLGAISRLAGSFDGSAITFATAGRASAPGQLEAEKLSEILPALEG